MTAGRVPAAANPALSHRRARGAINRVDSSKSSLGGPGRFPNGAGKTEHHEVFAVASRSHGTTFLSI